MALNRELDGLLAISVEQAVAAPYCGLLLADAGARLIKVERPEGDFARGYDTGAGGESVFFAWLNRGKESICIDLNKESDDGLLRAMLRKADIFLHNLSPGALANRGYTGPTLRRDNPGLITCEITGYGSHGTAAERKAYDFLIQAECGLCAVTGTAEHPARIGISITDISTGLTAFSAILRALIQRSRTQEGVDLSVSMFDVMADWMNMPLLGHRYLGGAPARMGLTHAFIAPYGAYATRDGQLLLIAVQNNREWQALCEQVLDRPELASDARFSNNTNRVTNRVSMDNVVKSIFAQRKRTELLESLGRARIASAQLSSVSDLSNHQFLRNLQLRVGDAQIEVADLPVQIAGSRATDVPGLDQHGSAIRREFGAQLS